MELSIKDAKIIWAYGEGKQEWEDLKAGIKYNKASLQRIFNKANSSKGVNLATLKQAKLLITKLVHDEEYMLRVRAIRKKAL
jgi:hypothetical protein